MGIFLPDGTEVPMEHVDVGIDNGIALAPVVFLDKDGNVTQLMIDAKEVVCFGVDGLWYVLRLADATWESFRVH